MNLECLLQLRHVCRLESYLESCVLHCTVQCRHPRAAKAAEGTAVAVVRLAHGSGVARLVLSNRFELSLCKGLCTQCIDKFRGFLTVYQLSAV